MISREVLGLFDLLKTKSHSIDELTKIVMIDYNKNFKSAPFKMVISGLKSVNNSQKFLDMSFVQSLYRNHFLAKKNYRVSLAKLQS